MINMSSKIERTIKATSLEPTDERSQKFLTI